MRIYATLFAFIALTCVSKAVLSQKQLYIVTYDTVGTLVPPFDSATSGPKLRIRVDAGVLGSGSDQSLKLILPVAGPREGLAVVADKSRREVKPDHISWRGKIRNQPESFVLLTQVGKVLSGHIRTKENKLYRISFLGNNVHQITEVYQRFFKDDRADSPGDLLRRSASTEDLETAASCCDTSGTIDVMVLYTPNAMSGAGGLDAIRAEIWESINITNESFEKSNINARIDLAHSDMIEFSESANRSVRQTRDALRVTNDNVMDEVHRLRNVHAADIVVLLIEVTGTWDGSSYIMDYVTPNFQEFAFSVVRRLSAFSNLSFPHEIGHVLGGRHDCSVDDSLRPFPYSHGYSVGLQRTIMSLNSAALRTELWSSPNLQFPDTRAPAGDISQSCQSHDAECLRNTFAVVAKFRCKQSCHTARRQPTADSTKQVVPILPIGQARGGIPIWLIILSAVLLVGIIVVLVARKKKSNAN